MTILITAIIIVVYIALAIGSYAINLKWMKGLGQYDGLDAAMNITLSIILGGYIILMAYMIIFLIDWMEPILEKYKISPVLRTILRIDHK